MIQKKVYEFHIFKGTELVNIADTKKRVIQILKINWYILEDAINNKKEINGHKVVRVQCDAWYDEKKTLRENLLILENRLNKKEKENKYIPMSHSGSHGFVWKVSKERADLCR